MTVRLYKSTDTGAPELRSNSPGDLIALLTACLVDGYGDKDPAGWTKPFSGTNVAAFKQGAGSNGMYLRVDDTMELTSSGWRYARVVGYEEMTDVDTGSPSPFPTDSQREGGLYWFTMSTGSGGWNDRDTPKTWVVVADEAFFYAYWRTYEYTTPTTYSQLYFFGDFISYNPADAYNTIIHGGKSASDGNTSSSSVGPYYGLVASNLTSSYSDTLCVARANDQESISNGASLIVDYSLMGATQAMSGGPSAVAYPNPGSNLLLTCDIRVMDPGSSGTAVLRGRLPGILGICHRVADVMGQGDTLTGQGDMSGREFMCFQGGNYGCLIETSDTWRD